MQDWLNTSVTVALRRHEIGKSSPYRLFFAAKGKSGASFGFMQGDLAARQPVVTETFVTILGRAGATQGQIQSLLSRLSVHLLGNPLDPQETDFVNGALAAQSALVDAMDQTILAGVWSGLDKCIAAAREGGRRISGKALLYFALWINMSGPPSILLTWLKGGAVNLPGQVRPAAELVTGADARAYLMATSYYMNNPGNAPHLDESVLAGAVLLPPGAVAG